MVLYVNDKEVPYLKEALERVLALENIKEDGRKHAEELLARVECCEELQVKKIKRR